MKGRHDEALDALRRALTTSKDLTAVTTQFLDLVMDDRFLDDSEPARFPLLEQIVGQVGGRLLRSRDPHGRETSLGRLVIFRVGNDFWHGTVYHELGIVAFFYFPSARQGLAILPARSWKEPTEFLRFTLAATGPTDVQ